MNALQLSRLATALAVPVGLAAIWRLTTISKHHLKWPFLCLLAVVCASNVVDIAGGSQTSRAMVFMVLTPLAWICYVLSVRALYMAIFSGYPGIAAFGRWSLYATMAITAIAAVGSIAITRNPLANQRSLVVTIQFVDEWLVFGLSIFLLFLLFTLLRYPIDLHRNEIVLCFVFSILLLTEALARFANHLTAIHYASLFNLVGQVVTIACYGAWIFLLNPQGEKRIIRVRADLTLGDEARLLGQLSSLNGVLLRAARK